MSFMLSSITPRIRGRLNDQTNTMFTDDVLLTAAQDACDELQNALELAGILVLEKMTPSPYIVIPAGFTSLGYNTTPALPADVLEPQRVDERLSNSSDLFVQMTTRMWEPNILPTDSLRYWSWREQNINFVGAITVRDIKIYYIKRLLNIQTINDMINVNNAESFLITRIAGMAARNIGEDTVRADGLDNEAAGNLTQLIRIGIKNKQRTRTRRRPWTIMGRRRWS